MTAWYDQHLHSWHSNDSDADPRENVRQALAMGLAGLTITDHFDTHPAEWDRCLYDYEKIAEEVGRLRSEFGSQVFIGHGIEICHQAEQKDRILAYLADHRFDIVLLSVHWLGERALHVREHWDGLDAAAGTRRYFEAVLDAVRLAAELNRRGQRSFDVLCHLDLVKRYTQRYFQTFDIRSHSDLIDEILRACIEAELALEVNLSTLRQSLPEPSPPDWVLRRYLELGGEAVTLGSDAHRPEDVGAGFTEGVALLRSVGCRCLRLFKNRMPHDELL